MIFIWEIMLIQAFSASRVIILFCHVVGGGVWYNLNEQKNK